MLQVLIDSIFLLTKNAANEVSSSWSLDEWKQFLDPILKQK